MIPFLQKLNEEFKKVCSESYLEYNTKSTIVYPYITYNLSSEDLQDQEGFYIDVDIFDDCGANTIELEQLFSNVKKHFKDLKILTDDVLLQFSINTGRMIPTESTTLRRRWVELYCKVDWRR